MTKRAGDVPPMDTDRIIADFLHEEAPPYEPTLLLPAVLARTALTRRRPAWRIPSWWLPASIAWRPRNPGRSNTMFTALKLAAMGAILALVGGTLIFGIAGSPSPSPEPSPIALPKPSGDHPALEAGTTYFLDDVWDEGSADLILTVPASGWLHGGEGHLAKHPIDEDGMWELLITPWWRARNLSVDPCHSQSGGELDPPVGPTADDLATALVAQAAGNASAPTDVTVDGYPGKRLELWLPAGLDLASCEGGEFDKYIRWFDESGCCQGGYMYPDGDGRNIVYILDVGDKRAVIDILYKSGISEADLAEAEQLVAAMRFRPLSPGASPSAAISSSPAASSAG